MKSTTSTLPGAQTRPRSLRPRSTSIRCSARSFASASSSVGEGGVLLGRRPAPAGAGDRVQQRAAAVDLDQRLGARADDVEAVEAQQVHVRARVGHAQHPVDVERARPSVVDLEPLRDDDLERLAGPDLLLGVLDGGQVVGRGRGCRGTSGSAVQSRRTASGSARLGQVGLHRVEAGHRVGVGLVDPLVGRVVVDRVGDQQDRAVLVVEHGEVGGEQHGQLGQLEVVVGDARAAARAGVRRRSRGSRPCRR